MYLSRAFLLIGTTILSVTNVCLVLTGRPGPRAPSDAYSWVGHDFPESFPLSHELATVKLTVEESVLYPLGESGDEAWRSLITANKGYCRLGPRNRLFAITMFHELHCLRIFDDGFGAGTELEHVMHCLHYLRHGTLCSADLTLEAGDFARRNFTRDRVGATHTCRDWSQVYDEFEVNYAAWLEAAAKQSVTADADH